MSRQRARVANSAMPLGPAQIDCLLMLTEEPVLIAEIRLNKAARTLASATSWRPAFVKQWRSSWYGVPSKWGLSEAGGEAKSCLLAQGIEARSDETLKAVQPEGQEPGGEAMRPGDPQ
jgi:hypothetical protein